MTIFFRRTWNDPRLDFSSMGSYTVVIRDELIDRVWVPDIFFTNEREANFHAISRRNEAIWLDPDGTIFLTSRQVFFPSYLLTHSPISPQCIVRSVEKKIHLWFPTYYDRRTTLGAGGTLAPTSERGGLLHLLSQQKNNLDTIK